MGSDREGKKKDVQGVGVMTAGIFDPYTMLKDVQAWIGEHYLLLLILIILIGFIALYFGWTIYEMFSNMTNREKTFKRGNRTSVMNTIRVEIIDRMKRKKRKI